MIDPRFDSRLMIVKEREKDRDIRIEQKFSECPKDIYLPGLTAWWKRVRSRAEPRLGELPLALRPSKFIRRSDEATKALDRVATSRNAEGDVIMDGVAYRLIGMAIARTFPRPKLTGFDRAAGFFDLNLRSWTEFIAQLKASDAKAWSQALAGTQPKQAEYIGFGNSGLSELQAAREQANTAGSIDLYSLWRGISRCHLMHPLRMRLWALVLINPGEVAKVLDRFEIPGAIKEACDELGIGRDREALLAFIRSTLPIVDANRKATGRVAGAFLPELVLEYAINLKQSVESATRSTETGSPHSPAHPITQLCQTELPAWFDEAFAAMLARDDGSFLLKHFAVHLVMLLGNNKRLGDSQDVHWIAVQSLQKVAESRSSSWIRQELFERKNDFTEVTKRISDYYPFLTYCIFDDSAVNDQWEWYSELLKKRDTNLIQHLNPYGNRSDWHFQIVGRLIASSQDPIGVVETGWKRLFDQRFEARFQIGGDASRPSVHFLESGRGALGWMVSKAPPEDALQSAQRLWEFLFIHEVEMHLGLARAANSSLARELTMLFAYAPLVFRTNIKSVFEKASGLFGEDPLLAAGIAVILLQNGFARSMLENLFQPLGGLAELSKRALKLSSLGLGDYPPVFADAVVADTLQP